MGDMKVFISSLISGFEAERHAARRAVTSLRHEPVMAEDFSARPDSPQIACLQQLRESDVIVLVLGANYGFVPADSAISATHQEYREAQKTKSVLAFIQQGVTPDPEQSRFIEEVQAWEDGLFRAGFAGSEDLQDGITRALYDYTLANAVGPVDEADLVARANALIPAESRNQVSSSFLVLAVAGGPVQRILRPVEMEEKSLSEGLQQAAMFGPNRLFDRSKGIEAGLENGDLIIRQERGASILLTEQGSMLLRAPLDDPEPAGRLGFGGMIIIEETVQQQLTTSLAFAAEVVERIDPTQRLTNIAVAVSIAGAEYLAWRTRAQNEARPNSMQTGITGRHGRRPVSLAVRRAALRLDRSNLIEDILVPLRRQFPSG